MNTPTQVPTGAPLEESNAAMPPSSINVATILSTIFTICGLVLGLIAAANTSEGDGTSESGFNDDIYLPNILDAQYKAQIYGVLAIAAFAPSIPILACGAAQYKKARGSKGIHVCMLLGWVFYGVGMLFGLVLLGASLVNYGQIKPAFVYFAAIFNVVPYFLFLAHAEHARRR